jgi:hypothetical protein
MVINNFHRFRVIHYIISFSHREIEQLKEELTELKQSSATQADEE